MLNMLIVSMGGRITCSKDVFSSVLDETYLWFCVRYVEHNPVRAKIVAKAEDYLWSSAINGTLQVTAFINSFIPSKDYLNPQFLTAFNA